jgi:hypothetical protein
MRIKLIIIKIKNAIYNRVAKNEIKKTPYSNKKFWNTGNLIIFESYFFGLFKFKYKVNKHTGAASNKTLKIFNKKIWNN